VLALWAGLQIRKSSSHCLVKVEDLDHLLNVSQVQTYVINGEPAVFLDKRTISGKGKPGVTRCEECSRGLHDAGCLFCSLGCKVIDKILPGSSVVWFYVKSCRLLTSYASRGGLTV
jgi:hypothetical protein